MAGSKKEKIIPLSEHINAICDKTGYSRVHVANMVRRNARKLGITKRDKRWHGPRASIARLRDLVINSSGCAYKLGERGPHAKR